MEAGASARLRIAGTVLVLGVAATAALSLAARPADAGTSELLLPDLKVPPPQQMYVEKGSGKTMLKFSHTTANVGRGPLEISPDLEGANCSGEGADWYDAYQYVYRDGDGSGVFERQQDGQPEQQPVPGCMYFHAPHNHYHFRDFALYDLHRERTGKLVATSDKVSFCVFDLTEFRPGLPGAEEHYGFENCDRQDGTHGISVGWADVYSATTPGQQLDVTGMRRGRYCLVAEADPEDRLTEMGTAGNNVRRVRIALRPGRGFVKPLDGPCRLP